MGMGPFGFGALPRVRGQEPVDLTPEQIAVLYNPRRLPGTGAGMTLDGTGELPAGLAEGMNAGGGVATFGANPPMIAPGAPPLDFDQRFGSAPPGQGFGLPTNDLNVLRASLASQGQPSPMPSPLPPARPSPADLATEGPFSSPATLRVQKSNMADRGPARTLPSPADMPAPGAVPAAGQMPPLSFGPAPGAPGPAPAPIAAPTPPEPQAEPGGAGGGFLSGLSRPSVYNTLLGIGSAMLSTRGIGNALAQGVGNASKLNTQQAATDLAQAEYGLKARKLRQADTGLNVTRAQLIAKGNTPADVDTAIAASQAGQEAPLKNLLDRVFPKAAEAPTGFTLNPDGSMRTITGGPEDPATRRANAQATAEGSAAGKPDEPFNLSAGQTRYSADGKPIVSAGNGQSDVFDRETKLRGEFSKQLGTFQDVHDGYGRVIAATEQRQVNPNAKSPAADIGLVFGFMKMLDPGSVVREGEYATAANAASVPERIRSAYNKAMDGEFLSPEQRQGFIEQAESLYGKARGGAEGVAERYRGIASQYGVDPGRSVYLPDPYKAPKVGASRTKLPEAGALPEVGSSRDAGSGITIKRVR